MRKKKTDATKQPPPFGACVVRAYEVGFTVEGLLNLLVIEFHISVVVFSTGYMLAASYIAPKYLKVLWDRLDEDWAAYFNRYDPGRYERGEHAYKLPKASEVFY